MSFPRYAKYKNSGVEWLGQMPEHWDLFPLKRDLDFLTSGSRGWAENYSDSGELFIRIGNLTRTSIALDLSDIQRVAVPEGAEGSRTKVQVGDVLFSITAYLGSVAVVPDALESAYVSQHVALARLRKLRLTPRWVGYVALSAIGKTWFETQSYGGTKIQLALDDVRNLPITAPSIAEQTGITAFLDRETAKIDALVEQQQRLIELLKEKRQAVISNAVTKGLNPDSPMKPSGLEWLGDVPAHWDLKPTKRLFRLVVDPAPEDNDYELLSIYTEIGVRPRKSLEAKGNKATTTDGYWMVRKGDLIVNKLLAWMGAIGISDYDGVTSPAYDVLRQRVPLDPRFYDLLFRCGICFSEFRRYSRGIMDMRLRLYFDELGRLLMPQPPTAEQHEIVTFLEEELARFDELTAEAQRAIELLQERRTALISAAVTGQIDVRSLADRQAA